MALELTSPEQVLSRVSRLLGSELPRAVPKRQAEFAAGRHAAELALARWSCTEPVARAADGAPLWPSGFVGSISHAGALAVAAVASDRVLDGLGVDLEPVVSNEVYLEIHERVLSPAERELLARALPELSETERFTLGFSAKESFYKCVNPLSGEFFEFHDARVVSADAARIVLALDRPLRGGFAQGFALSGRFVLDAGRIESAIWLPK